MYSITTFEIWLMTKSWLLIEMSTREMLADELTKALTKDTFKKSLPTARTHTTCWRL